jgi:Na+/H+ antiporter NhaD/arsenite permease-like protein
MLLGQTLGLSFGGYLADAALPSLLGLLATWGIIAFEQHGRWRDAGHGPPAPPRDGDPLEPIPAFDAWQTAKGLGVAAALLVAFLFTSWPRELCALAGAGVLLTSRKLHSRRMLGLVDWQLLVLFMGLFVVNGAFAATGLPERAVAWLAERGLDPARPPWLFALSVLLSNAVSNVPAVMLLLPVAHHELAGPVLALASTLAGNHLLVGSIANLIVADAAAQRGIALDWRRHARTGVPVTLATLAIAGAWLGWRAASG